MVKRWEHVKNKNTTRLLKLWKYNIGNIDLLLNNLFCLYYKVKSLWGIKSLQINKTFIRTILPRILIVLIKKICIWEYINYSVEFMTQRNYLDFWRFFHFPEEKNCSYAFKVLYEMYKNRFFILLQLLNSFVLNTILSIIILRNFQRHSQTIFCIWFKGNYDVRKYYHFFP